MIGFTQSILGTQLGAPTPETAGDCTRACIASILEIDPANLPNPHGEGDWGAQWRKALAPFGVQPIWIGRLHEKDMEAWWELGFPGYWMATVKLSDDEMVEGDPIGHHTVVMLWDQLAHDPIPGSPFLEMEPDELRAKIVHATLFLPIDPKLGVVR